MSQFWIGFWGVINSKGAGEATAIFLSAVIIIFALFAVFALAEYVFRNHETKED